MAMTTSVPGAERVDMSTRLGAFQMPDPVLTASGCVQPVAGGRPSWT